MNSILAIVPARGGSKGLPKKNIQKLCGEPMINYTISAAIESGIFDDVIVSTDDEEIARVSQRAGAQVPFLRPATLSGDSASSVDVVLHAIQFMENKGKRYNKVCLLQPTSPLRTAQHIRGAYQVFNDRSANSVISICECDHSPLWSNTLEKDGRMDHFIREELKGKRRQELPRYYRINGAIYLFNTDFIKNNLDFIGEKTYCFLMDRVNSVDVDTNFDLFLAEVTMKKYGIK